MEVTAFQRRVYDAVSAIPEGRVISYRRLAESVGCGSAQAVGQALRKNPYAPDVPCHRVITSSLHIGGYMGMVDGSQMLQKRQLLEREGVVFDVDGRLLDEEQMLNSL